MALVRRGKKRKNGEREKDAQNKVEICRICLKQTKDDFQSITAVKDIFDVIGLKIKVSVSKDPVICSNCFESVCKFFNFKSSCLYTEDRLAPICSTMDNTKVDVIEVLYFKENQDENAGNYHDRTICRLCLKREHCVAVDTLEEDFVKDVVARCIPEIDMTVNKNPMICTECMESLTGYSRFVNECLGIEEEIVKYRRTLKDRYKRYVELSKVRDFVLKSMPSYEEGDGSVVVKSEREDENTVTDDDCSTISQQELTIKSEDVLMETEQVQSQDRSPQTPQKRKSSDITDNFESTRVGSKLRSPRRLQKTKSPDVANNLKPKKMHKCDKCKYTAHFKHHMERHFLSHLDPASRKMVKCSSCPYQALSIDTVKNHEMMYHSSKPVPYLKCRTCNYQTPRKGDLKKHMICHVNPDDTKLFSCDKCPFTTVRKESFKRHAVTHEEHSKQKYKCEKCTFASATKIGLWKHSAVHVDTGQTFQCHLCVFETKRKDSLRNHVLVHRKHLETETGTLKCFNCDYETSKKKNLMRHMVVHQPRQEQRGICKEGARDELTCAICSYKTLHKESLQVHIVFKHQVKGRTRPLYTTYVPGLQSK